MTVDHRAWIECDETGRAWISGSKVKVLDLVLDHVAYGWSADELHAQFSYLSLAQIHGALAYYYDHVIEFDKAIEESLSRVSALRVEVGDSPARRRLALLKYQSDKPHP